MYYRRLKIFLAMVVVVLAVWMARLGLLQLVYGEHYLEQARRNLINPIVSLPTGRGRIMDRHNRLLAVDEPETVITVEYGILTDNPHYLATGSYRTTMSRGRALERAQEQGRHEYYARILAEIGRVCGCPADEIELRRGQIIQQVETIRAAVSRRMGRRTAIPEERMPHVLIRDISIDAAARLQGLLAEVPGIAVESRRRRSYPIGKGRPDHPESLAHLVGYEGAVASADLLADPFAGDERRRYLAGDSRGLVGVERSAEPTLRGWRGRFQDDRDGQILLDEPPVGGGPVRLAIDSQLQYYLYRVLARHVELSPWPTGGAVVVINIGERHVAGQTINDGDILALVSYPSFDPNRWRDNWERMNSDRRRRPMTFRAVAETYPPGSIIKPAVIAAALHDGHARLDQAIDCPGFLIRRGHHAFNCWAEWGHGHPLSPSDALKYSCNVYCYKVGQEMGLARLTHWLDRFGCGGGDSTGLAEERAGMLPGPLWLATHLGRGPTPGDARNVSIGQGELRVTPLAAANMMAAIARDGVHVRPTLVVAGPRPAPVSLGISRAHIAAIRDGMVRVVNEQGGTAREYAFMDNVKLAGKTGSATTGRMTIDGQPFPPHNLRDHRDRPTNPAHAWFAGFAPAEQPTIAVACLVEYGMNGGRVAGPLARDVVQVCLNMGYVPGRGEDIREVDGIVEPELARRGGAMP